MAAPTFPGFSFPIATDTVRSLAPVLQSLRSSAKYIFWFILITFVGGFLLAETSGLLGRGVTANSTVASVNGRDVSYELYSRVVQNAEQEQSERLGRALTLDERNQI